jgi:hypothetical protein
MLGLNKKQGSVAPNENKEDNEEDEEPKIKYNNDIRDIRSLR